MNRSAKITLAGVSALGLLGASIIAQAGEISFSTAFNLASAGVVDRELNGSDNPITSSTRGVVVSLPDFDPSLGSLRGVSLTFETDWSLTSTATATDLFGLPVVSRTSGGSRIDLGVQLLDPTSPGNFVSESEFSRCVGFVGCLGSSSDSGSFDGSLDLSGIDLSFFAPPPPPVGGDINIALVRLASAEVLSCGIDDICTQTNSNNGWSGTVTVTYYVPEPGTLALMAAGMLGLGVSARRRQRR